ncbi:MAG: pirin family protein [Deltaproteobacteria bacterium]|uniref:pirin family protein n=1 Tax=Desulfobacula sp. TaxID=2593537 RepID=UPI001996BE14|nr:pirin family protein [Candidatus Desulfobacula maris]MBL6994592.1 pirin family protein [Desulfobacula sp.]
MEKVRKVKKVIKSIPILEGAGVHLNRAFGSQQVPQLDPFLLLDDFHSNNPEKYIKGFPWHPHRGIETISYILHGEVEHGDSMGNKGIISSGDVQWMTAGNGIIHQEMPKGDKDNLLWGFQLWANLPASHKMMPPRYQEIKKDQIPELELDTGVNIKIICGMVNDVEGPVKDIVIDPQFLDVTIPKHTVFDHKTLSGHKVFAYVLDGQAFFDQAEDQAIGLESLVIFDDGNKVNISTNAENVRFLLVSGRPINEPIAWQGPIVMNTDQELETAFMEVRNNTFLKHQ